jgi:GT2 family glycosyltransferase
LELSIIILTWNTRDYLDKCLRSILKYTEDISFEIIVVDNGSDDGTEMMIRENFPDVVVIRNHKNLGTAQRNRGLEAARGEYVCFVDSDVEILEPNTFSELIGFLKQNPNVGLVAPKLVLNNGDTQLSCKRFLTFYTPFIRRFDFIRFVKESSFNKNQLMAEWNHNDIRDVDYVVCAFWVFPKSTIDKIGMLDEKIFYAPEDVDYCLRIWKGGLRVVYYPFVKAKHHYQRITRTFFSRITFEHIKGLIYYFIKHKYLVKPRIS